MRKKASWPGVSAKGPMTRLSGDLIQPFQLDGVAVRGRLVRLCDTLADIQGRHGYPDPVAGLLGETLALSAALSAGLKYDGVFILQIQSDGPVNVLVADVTSSGALRGYAHFDEDKVGKAKTGEPVPRWLGAGHMAFTVDQGPRTERYQGVTALEGATLADCAHGYFRQSEQLETAIVLAAQGNGLAAAALMVQRLPEKEGDGIDPDISDDDWRRTVALTGSVKRHELLDPALSPRDLLFRLYHEDGLRVFEPKALGHGCRCSRDKVSATLASFPRADIDAMAEDGRVTVTCEFCKEDYVFPPADLDALFSS